MNEVMRALVEVSWALAADDDGALNAALRAAAAVASAEQIEEALLQSYLFLGYPAALRGLAAWRNGGGGGAPVRATNDQAVWEQRGRQTCMRVYGSQFERLRTNVAALHPDIAQWMLTEGYGKVIGRPGLDLVTREACIVTLLAAQNAAPQLYSHLRGMVNAGADVATVDALVAMLGPRLSTERRRALDEQWDSVRSRRAAGRRG